MTWGSCPLKSVIIEVITLISLGIPYIPQIQVALTPQGRIMTVKVVIPTPLRRYTANQEFLELEGSTIDQLLNQLTTEYGDLKKHLYTADGTLRNFVNVYVNDEDIRHLQKGDTPVSANDVVSIVPSIAGGRNA